jgi:predicted nuclease with RNAse H fold
VTGVSAGIDVGAQWVQCAVVDAAGRTLECGSLPAGDARALAGLCSSAEVVAIDAPEAPSTSPHADRIDLAPKFRAARCAEIELGRSHGSWVPWVAPAGPPFPRWMEVGFDVYRALHRPDGPELIEVYPHAAFRELAGGGRLAKKSTAAGRGERADLLSRAGLDGAALANEPSHDALDALAAALVALDRSRRRARRVTCGHDTSAIWLPASRGLRSPRYARRT